LSGRFLWRFPIGNWSSYEVLSAQKNSEAAVMGFAPSGTSGGKMR